MCFNLLVTDDQAEEGVEFLASVASNLFLDAFGDAHFCDYSSYSGLKGATGPYNLGR